MSDQARTLRHLMQSDSGSSADVYAKTIQVIGVSPGAGASTVCEILRGSEKSIQFFDAGSGIEMCAYDKIIPSAYTLLVIDAQAKRIVDVSAEMVSALSKACGVKRIGVVVNKMSDAARAREISRELQHSLGRFSSVKIEYFGHIPEESLIKSNKSHSATGCLRLMAKRL